MHIRGTKDEPRKQDIVKRRSLPSRAGKLGKGRGHPQKKKTQASRQGLPGLTEIRSPHRLHHDPRHRSVRCQVAK